MKTRLQSLLTGLALLSTLISQLSTVFAQDTAFAYQGRLTDSGSLANGSYDFIFLVFDAPSGGSSVGGAVNTNGIGVSNGLFTVALDFGNLPFTGPRRWLQISVSTNGSGSFAALAPRQEITRAPYATYANIAATVTNGAVANAQLAINAVGSANIQSNAVNASQIASGQVVKSLNGLTDAVSLTQGANVTINTVGNSLQISAPASGMALPFSGSASSSGSLFTLANSGTGAAGAFLGNVGIGTTTPSTPLYIATAAEPIIVLQDTGPNSTQGGYITFWNATPTETAWVGFGTPGSPHFSIVNARSGGNIVLSPFTGNVGIGTTTPVAKLDVHGDIRLGPSGQFRATSGEENLRIVRGTVQFDGARLRGSGFTSERLSEAKYRITFTTRFSTPPSITGAVFQNTANFFNGFELSVSGGGATTSEVIVFISKTDSGELSDHNFDFIAIGPR